MSLPLASTEGLHLWSYILHYITSVVVEKELEH